MKGELSDIEKTGNTASNKKSMRIKPEECTSSHAHALEKVSSYGGIVCCVRALCE